MAHPIEALRRELRLALPSRPEPVLSFDLPAIDRLLPRGGLPLAGLHEIVPAPGEMRGNAAGTVFAAGILARLSGPVVWCRRQADMFAPALATAGLDPARILWADAPDDAKVLACVEDGLRHGGAAAVVGEVGKLSVTASRRLQLAAKEGGSLCLILVRARRSGPVDLLPTAALTRWRVTPAPAAEAARSGMPRGRWQVELLRCRGGEAASIIVEACDATGHLALSADLADRPLATRRGSERAAG